MSVRYAGTVGTVGTVGTYGTSYGTTGAPSQVRHPGGSVERPDEIQTRPAGRRTKGRFSTSRAGMAPSSKVLVTPRLP